MLVHSKSRKYDDFLDVGVVKKGMEKETLKDHYWL